MDFALRLLAVPLFLMGVLGIWGAVQNILYPLPPLTNPEPVSIEEIEAGRVPREPSREGTEEWWKIVGKYHSIGELSAKGAYLYLPIGSVGKKEGDKANLIVSMDASTYEKHYLHKPKWELVGTVFVNRTKDPSVVYLSLGRKPTRISTVLYFLIGLGLTAVSVLFWRRSQAKSK